MLFQLQSILSMYDKKSDFLQLLYNISNNNNNMMLIPSFPVHPLHLSYRLTAEYNHHLPIDRIASLKMCPINWWEHDLLIIKSISKHKSTISYSIIVRFLTSFLSRSSIIWFQLIMRRSAITWPPVLFPVYKCYW